MVIVQYGQWDGYPSGQGARVLRFLKSRGSIERLTVGLQHIYYPSKAEVDEIWERIEKSQIETDARMRQQGKWEMRSMATEICPSLSRDTAAGILDLVAKASEEKKVPIQRDFDFITDTLFCEYIWVLDLDDRVFEGYGGHEEKEGAGSQRFDKVEGVEGVVPRLICKFGFDDLPISIDDVDKESDVDEIEEGEVTKAD